MYAYTYVRTSINVRSYSQTPVPIIRASRKRARVKRKHGNSTSLTPPPLSHPDNFSSTSSAPSLAITRGYPPICEASAALLRRHCHYRGHRRISNCLRDTSTYLRIERSGKQGRRWWSRWRRFLRPEGRIGAAARVSKRRRVGKIVGIRLELRLDTWPVPPYPVAFARLAQTTSRRSLSCRRPRFAWPSATYPRRGALLPNPCDGWPIARA